MDCVLTVGSLTALIVLTEIFFWENVHELTQETLILGEKHIDVLIRCIVDYELKNLP